MVDLLGSRKRVRYPASSGTGAWTRRRINGRRRHHMAGNSMLTLTKVLLLTFCVAGCSILREGVIHWSGQCMTKLYARSGKSLVASRRLSVTCSTRAPTPQDFHWQLRPSDRGGIGNDVPPGGSCVSTPARQLSCRHACARQDRQVDEYPACRRPIPADQQVPVQDRCDDVLRGPTGSDTRPETVQRRNRHAHATLYV